MLPGGVSVSGGIRRYNRPERDFLMVHRSFARLTNKELSPRGKVVGLYVLSHDHGYVQTQQDIARRLDMAVRTVADALTDLEEAGLLVRVAERNARGHRTGTAMHVSDVPFTDQERADLLGSLPAKSADAESADAESAGHKERNSKQESKSKEDQPSGGDAAGAAPAGVVEEEPVKTKSPQPALFEVEAPPLPPRQKDSKDVVAAYVDSFRAAHSRDPLRSDIGRVASTAKALLGRSEATVEELISCARTMGTGTWANLSQELKNSRSPRRTQVTRRNLPLLSDDPRWDPLADATRREEEALMQAHPDMWTEEVMA